MLKKILILALLALAFVGCAKKPVIEPGIDPAIKELNEVARSIQSDLEKLARIQQAEFEEVRLHIPPAEGPLTKKITLRWSGPLVDVLEVIASLVDFEFQVRGKPPANPILVNIDETREPAFNVLEDLGWKAGKHHVTVDAEERVIQLTYFEGTRR